MTLRFLTSETEVMDMSFNEKKTVEDAVSAWRSGIQF